MKIRQEEPTKHEINLGRIQVPAYRGEAPNVEAGHKAAYVTVTIDLNRLRGVATRAIHAKTGRARMMKGAVLIKAEGIDWIPNEE